ncbi:Alpha beta hydrolase [Lasiodiplodia theobromae]|uniref:Alpha beta hydrolase n=1 Tax=Lasiodiplodia theobromae TaxID=45133 RepID=UPI0015C33901|nr:Alpha beta hydrolase [Lasiodiplodia theobromae]KAF4545944.1 Alpha beta hydrolase [Lasiodiplodia theobromae]
MIRSLISLASLATTLGARSALGATSTATSAASASLPSPTAIDLASGGGTVGALFRPAPGGDAAKAATAIMVMHAEQDYWSFYPCTELPARGYTVLCANNAASKSGYMSDLNFEDMMVDVGYAVGWLRNQSDIERVVLFGHSGGGAMLAQYQNVAENGAAACNGSEKISPCSSAVEGLPAADGVVLDDANFGIGPMMVMSLNPAITDETSGMQIDEALDLYSAAHGWSSTGSSNYSAEFAKQFAAGVHARNTRLIAYAKERLAAIENGTGLFADDEPFYIPDALYLGMNNKFFPQDLSYLHHTTYPWKLLHKNGSYTTQIVPSVRTATTVSSLANSYLNGGLKTTIKRFLATFAVTTTEDFGYQADGVTGIVWNSSQLVPIAAVKGIHVPLLTMGNTGHYEFMNIEKTHLAAVSNDTDIAFVEGAQHTINTCTECEAYAGEFGDTVKTTFDYVDQWLSKPGRFF